MTKHSAEAMQTPPAEPKVVGLLAEYDHPETLMDAAEGIRDEGFQKWDAHTPFPVHGLDKAMGVKRTFLPVLVFIGGTIGCLGGLWLQWYTNAVDYPFIISGKPFFSVPASIPVVFELTILLASLTAFAGMLFLNQLPQFYSPILKSDRFRRATDDRFFIFIDARDPKFDIEKTEKLLASLKAVAVEQIKE